MFTKKIEFVLNNRTELVTLTFGTGHRRMRRGYGDFRYFNVPTQWVRITMWDGTKVDYFRNRLINNTETKWSYWRFGEEGFYTARHLQTLIERAAEWCS